MGSEAKLVKRKFRIHPTSEKKGIEQRSSKIDFFALDKIPLSCHEFRYIFLCFNSRAHNNQRQRAEEEREKKNPHTIATALIFRKSISVTAKGRQITQVISSHKKLYPTSLFYPHGSTSEEEFRKNLSRAE